METINESTLWEIGGYPQGQLVSRKLDFRSRKKVDEVEALFQHSVSSHKTITAQGIPKLTRTGPYDHYTVNLFGSIKYGDTPGRYVPYRVYYRINGRWIAHSTKRRALSPFDVIESNPSSTQKESEV